MEDWSFVESRFDDLAADLDEAKKHLFKVNLEFDRRFRVLTKIIHRNRRGHIYAARHEPKEQEALTKRYVSLDLYDLARMYRRAKKEFLYSADDPRLSQVALIMFQNLYHHRKIELVQAIKAQFFEYERLTGLEIINKFTNGWKELMED